MGRRRAFPTAVVRRAQVLLRASAGDHGTPEYTAVRRQLASELPEGEVPSTASLSQWWKKGMADGTSERLAAGGRNKTARKPDYQVVPPPRPVQDMTDLEYAVWRHRDLEALMKRVAVGNPGAVAAVDKRMEFWRRQVASETAKKAPAQDRLERLGAALEKAGLAGG